MCLRTQHSSWNSSRDIFLTVSKEGIILIDSLHLSLRSINCLNISRPLKQLLKVSVQWRSQKHLLGKFSANYYQRICSGVYFWQSSIVVWMPLDRCVQAWELFIERYFIFDIETNIQVAPWNYKSLTAKTFDGHKLKMKAPSPM